MTNVYLEIQDNGICQIGSGRAIMGKNTNFNHRIRATIHAATSFPQPGYPSDWVVEFAPGESGRHIGCEFYPNTANRITYSVVGEQVT